MTDALRKLSFPRIRRVAIRDFSLFKLKPIIKLTFQDGVFCLAGANGLGKSTFLATINYVLTGIVSDPSRSFDSVEEYYKHSSSFAREYFLGRIDENQRETAEVGVEFDVGERTYDLSRGLFESNELRSLSIREKGKRKVVYDGVDFSASERDTKYREQLTNDVGLNSFDQFVFLQQFILTFDERRHLLFWNKKVLEQALYMAFGVDQAQANRADTIRREAEKADSLARNFNWQATEARKRLEDLKAALKTGDEPAEDLAERHKELTREQQKAVKVVARLEAQQRDANLRLATVSAEHVSLRAEYNKEVSKRLRHRPPVAQHPLVASSRRENKCGLCGATGAAVGRHVQAQAEGDHCPLCTSAIDRSTSKPREVERLRQLDQALVQARKQLDDVVQTVGRIAEELETARSEEHGATEALNEFEQDNERFLEHLRSDKRAGSLVTMIDTFRQQMDDFLKRKAEQYRRRDERRKELRKLQEIVAARYKAAEAIFVPLFRELAFQFLGLEFDIRLETTQANPSITLVVDVKGSARRQFHQLSESQRFFIDIALRMALSQYMSAERGKATLFIDTPEGSLDIAYEKRAGNMLASFASRGYPIIMTANINTSRLLMSLASELGHERMVLNRMTSWAELSDVQNNEEKLFKEAFNAIEKCLDGNEAKSP